MLKDLFTSVRPHQWYKNSLLFVCVIFSGNILNGEMWSTAALAFAYFCLAAGGGYLVNDVIDRASDRRHPVKKDRPVAAGRLKVSHALTWAAVFMVGALTAAALTLPPLFTVALAAYVALALLYSTALKYHVLLDVLTVASGFVLRAVAGCLAVGVSISSWLIVCTFLLALFMALEKRWYEVATLPADDGPRQGIFVYSASLLEKYISATTGALIVAYLFYATVGSQVVMLATVPLVIYGLFRYQYLVHDKRRGGEPSDVFRDRPLLITAALWTLLVMVLVQFFGVA